MALLKSYGVKQIQQLLKELDGEFLQVPYLFTWKKKNKKKKRPPHYEKQFILESPKEVDN